MLGKLMKHEFRATGRIMLPLLGLLVLLSILAGFSAKLLDSDVDSGILNFLSVIFITGFILSLFAAMIVAFVLMIQRFYKNLMGDEGYLMMTLPASTDAHIFSKLTVSAVWFAATGFVCGLSVLIMAMTNVSFADLGVFIRGFDGITEYVSVLNIIGYCIEALLVFFAGSFTVCLHFYAAIAVGHAFSNHKALLSVVFYFVISFLLNTIQMALIWLGNATGLLESFMGVLEARTPAEFSSLLHLGLLGALLYTLFIAALCYLPTRILLDKKLNLA